MDVSLSYTFIYRKFSIFCEHKQQQQRAVTLQRKTAGRVNVYKSFYFTNHCETVRLKLFEGGSDLNLKWVYSD